MEQKPPKVGRPTKPDAEKLVQRSVRMLPAEWARVDEFGLEWMRGAIRRAKPPGKAKGEK